jgi:hypothetical protein
MPFCFFTDRNSYVDSFFSFGLLRDASSLSRRLVSPSLERPAMEDCGGALGAPSALAAKGQGDTQTRARRGRCAGGAGLQGARWRTGGDLGDGRERWRGVGGELLERRTPRTARRESRHGGPPNRRPRAGHAVCPRHGRLPRSADVGCPRAGHAGRRHG